ncbi:hypothetical protein [Salinibacter sp.]|uniref:hypothetical protein n=1 Tax=Salinibacter sp. TaxID=2065818 RepID=UPI0021E7E1D7|nr:hypothetical protein [Salinibacter sp.]
MNGPTQDGFFRSQEAAPYDDGLDDMSEEERQLRQELTTIFLNTDGHPRRADPAAQAKRAVITDALATDNPAACIRSIIESEDVSVARSEAAERLAQSLHLELSDK